MEIRKILFATDFSEGSSRALPLAVDLSKKFDAELICVHVVFDLTKTAGWYVPHASLDEIYLDIERSARSELEKTLSTEVCGVRGVSHVILKGSPHEEITRFALEHKIDMIVLGTHGRHGIDRILFGSTAEQIVRNAPCPVLSVRVPVHHG